MRVLAAIFVLAAASEALAEEGTEPAPKKVLELQAKAAAASRAPSDAEREKLARELRRRVGKPPDPVVSIRNRWTQETLAVPAHMVESVDPEVWSRFMRCHFTEEPTDMDLRLLKALVSAARRFGKNRVHIVSGFRHPKYNLILRKKGREVARDSQHTRGNAVDFRVPGVPVQRLWRFVRSLRLGGVGFYPHSAFVHADVGPIRFWKGN